MRLKMCDTLEPWRSLGVFGWGVGNALTSDVGLKYVASISSYTLDGTLDF